MFLIMGINSGRKEIEYQDVWICGICGQYGRCQVYMTYTCFSLFFIPLFKWNRQYVVEMSCCHSRYALKEEVGRALLRGERRTIQMQDLTLLHRGNSGNFGRTWQNFGAGTCCSACGCPLEEEFVFCPRCGKRL